VILRLTSNARHSRVYSSMTDLREKSPEAVVHPDLNHKQYDFIYIDADHSYDALISDIHAWWPKVRVGGVMAGHDYNNRGNKRVKKAVDFLFTEVQRTGERCASWWVIKTSEYDPLSSTTR